MARGRRGGGRRYKKRSNVRQRKRTAAMKRYGSSALRSIKRLNSSNQGYLNVNRRLPLISIATANAAQGSTSISDPTGTCLSLLPAVAVPNGLPTVYDVPFSMTFRLDQLSNYTEFTDLFDQYKINAVKVFLRSYANSDGALGFPMPWIETWNDHDSSIAPTIALSREIMGVKHKYFSATKNVCTMYVKPKPSIEVGGTSITGMIPRRSPWLDCADVTIPHYSIKGIIHNFSLPSVAAGNNRLEFDVVVNTSFKDVQ